jgi:hypothetical protein
MMAAFAAGATIEQRYPGASQEDARRAAGPQLSAFAAASWAVVSETWVPATAAAGTLSSIPAASAGKGGTLVVVFRADRDADLPPRLSLRLDDPEPRSTLTPFAIRVVVALIVAAVLIVAFAYVVGTATPSVVLPSVIGLAP